MAKKMLKQLLQETDECIFAPCVYDCASARAVEMVGFKAMMFSSGEFSLATQGAIDYGFTNLTDLEYMVGRVVQTSSLPLAVDIEDGFGGPLAVYRTCKRIAQLGASAVQMEDGCDMEDTTALLDREHYFAKVEAALDALKGTNCMLIARTNADPKTNLDEGIERCRIAHEMGAEITTVVNLKCYDDAKIVGERVPGWKMYPDVAAQDGVPEVTVEQVYPLGFNFMTTHYTLKAAMDGMLEHGLENVKQQGSLYTCMKKGATGILGMSATPLFDPQAYMELENKYSKGDKEYTIVGNEVEEYPEGFVKVDIKDRF